MWYRGDTRVVLTEVFTPGNSGNNVGLLYWILSFGRIIKSEHNPCLTVRVNESTCVESFAWTVHDCLRGLNTCIHSHTRSLLLPPSVNGEYLFILFRHANSPSHVAIRSYTSVTHAHKDTQRCCTSAFSVYICMLWYHHWVWFQCKFNKHTHTLELTQPFGCDAGCAQTSN